MPSASRLSSAALALASVLALAGAGQAGSRVSGKVDASRPFLVKIHADWCGTCARMAPALEALEQKLGREVRFVVLDVTDDASAHTAWAVAKRLEMLEFFYAHKNRTGTVGVLRGDTREVVTVLKGETDTAVYEAALAEARGGGS